MFLNMLNEKEQRNFLELAYKAMEVDGVIKQEEINVFEMLKREVAMIDYEVKHLPEEQLIKEFDSSTKMVKKAVIVELGGILDADEIVVKEEENWLVKIGETWGFRSTEIRRLLRWVQDFNDLLAEGYEYITRKERL